MKHPARSALLACALTVMVTLTVLWIANPHRTRRDIVQQRAAVTTGVLEPGSPISQTFTSRENGLQAIELQIAAEQGVPRRLDTRVRATLERLDDPAGDPVRIDVSVQASDASDSLWFRFNPLRDSAGGHYRLTVVCQDECGIALRASAHDSLAEGSLFQSGSPVDGDLAMTNYYAGDFRALAEDFGAICARWMPGLLAGLLLLGGPGLAGALIILGQRTAQPAVLLATALTAGLTFWPLALLWLSTAGLALTPASAWCLVVASLIVVAVVLRRRQRAGLPSLISPWDAPQVVVMVITAMAILLRLVQARDLLVPAWIDSVHHTMLTSLIAENGVVPISGAPYLQVESLHYHYGFHAVAAILTWLSDRAPAESVLLLGQLLSALAGLPLYALATMLASQSRSRPSVAMRWAGTLAAAVPAFLTYMPAYYVSWGRYTQLAGLVMLPVILALSVRLVSSGWRTRNALPLAALIGGLAITHYRVVFYYALFWIAGGILAFLGALGRPRGVRSATSLAWTALRLAGLAILFVAPWALHLGRSVSSSFDLIYGSWAAAPGVETAVPVALLKSGHTEWVLAAAGLGLLYGLVTKRHWAAWVGLWAGLCLLVSDPSILGLRGSWFVHGTSAVISYWLPAGLLSGLLAAGLFFAPLRFLRGLWRRRWLAGAQLALACILSAWVTYSLWGQSDVVNSRTVLVHPPDMPAIGWAREHLPEDSLVLINAEPWQQGLPMGSDAGWWLPYLAGAQVTYPSVLFTQGTAAYRAEVLSIVELVRASGDLSSPVFVDRLSQAGVTHVFVGSRGGPLQPDRLREPYYVELFRYGPTRFYRFDAPVP
ncbi:MAG: hypothetical protein R6X16_01245 [Anaerolineae bacterium]